MTYILCPVIYLILSKPCDYMNIIFLDQASENPSHDRKAGHKVTKYSSLSIHVRSVSFTTLIESSEVVIRQLKSLIWVMLPFRVGDVLFFFRQCFDIILHMLIATFTVIMLPITVCTA